MKKNRWESLWRTFRGRSDICVTWPFYTALKYPLRNSPAASLIHSSTILYYVIITWLHMIDVKILLLSLTTSCLALTCCNHTDAQKCPSIQQIVLQILAEFTLYLHCPQKVSSGIFLLCSLGLRGSYGMMNHTSVFHSAFAFRKGLSSVSLPIKKHWITLLIFESSNIQYVISLLT